MSDTDSTTAGPVLEPVTDEIYWIDSRIEEMGEDVLQRAYANAKSEFGGVVADPESEEFKDEFNKQLMLLVATDDLKKLEAQNLAYASGVSEDGQLEYTAVEPVEETE